MVGRGMLSEEKLKGLVKEFGTPAYVFDIHELRKRVKAIKGILGDQIELCFAMKANPFLISYLDPFVDKFEVCSPGEYLICKKEKIPAQKIVMSGVYKRLEDIKDSFQDNFNGIYTAESIDQYEKIIFCAQNGQKKVRILLRFTSGSQFGMSQEDIEKIILKRETDDFAEIVGIHFFCGTQKKNTELIRYELNEIDSLCKHIYEKYHVKINNIEYGAGLFFDYFSKEDGMLGEVKKLKAILDSYQNRYHFTIELGRYLCAECGQYISKVVDIKNNNGKNYCIIDGGIHHLNYYGQMLGIKVPDVQVVRKDHDINTEEKWTVCGALCTIHDILLKDFKALKIEKGDIFVFNNSGAYSVTETGYLFLSRDLPQILAAEDKIELIRGSRPTFDINSRDIK